MNTKKRIAVVANDISFANYIKSELELYFEDVAKIVTYSTKDVERMDAIEEEVVVLSAFTIFKKVSEKIKDHNVLHVITMALSKANIEKLEKAPRPCRALLVNLDNRTCMQVITQIYEAGFKDLDLVPYYGDEESWDKSIKIAITPDEVDMVPDSIETIVDIGQRAVDTNSIIELAEKLDVKGIFSSEKARNARANVVVTAGGVEKLLNENESINDNIRALVEYIEEGIIITDNTGGIYIANDKTKQILRDKSDVLEGFGIEDIIPDFYAKVLEDKDTLVRFENQNLIFSKKDIVANGSVNGSIITVKNFEEVENRQHGIRTRIAGNKHVARFTFDDIVGESDKIKECISIGKQIAKSDASVLIIGATGTGKEVFAQSIHNASKRSQYNFVALNCAAIPENLLESELFGYEEGAFTGAKKGGKIGYFELAHKGTIFLDEIGEMPLSLQSKLLRVLEERAVSKVGSNKLIDVDVRVIAATNKNLFQLVKEKSFREDLYYRLKVLPLNIPNLNDRGNDILVLFDSFAKNIGARWKCDEDARELLIRHRWNGNVREIRNVVEYLDSLEKPVISVEMLEDNFRIQEPQSEDVENEGLKLQVSRGNDNHNHNHIEFILREGRNIELIYDILKILYSKKQQKKKAGRLEIENIISNSGLDYTETEIRGAMKKLSDMGYIKSSRGRGGSSITDSGNTLMEEIKGLIG